MYNKILDLLYRSFDEKLDTEKQRQLEEALSTSAELREERERLLLMRKKIREQSKHSFGEQFVGSVMNAILKSEDRDEEYIFLNTFLRFVRPTAIVAAILATGIIGYNLTRADNISWEKALGLSEVSIEEVFDPASYLVLETEQ